MKKWKCTVCGYIHTGDAPPEKCPVCGAPKNQFVEVSEDGTPKPTPAAPAKQDTATAEQTMKKWKCTVCGYIHTGGGPPEKCPVCGAPKTRFVELAEASEPQPTPAAATKGITVDSQQEEPSSPQTAMDAEDREDRTEQQPQTDPPTAPSRFKDSKYRVLFDLLTKYHGHPISVHIPNGLLPVAVLFIILSAVFGLKGMAGAAVYNLGVVALAMPLVLFTGWVDWQNRFNGAITRVFTVKIACGIIVTVTAWILFIWLLIDPAVVTTPAASRVAFFMINLIMLGAAATAGWHGGKLVFRD